MHLIPSKILVVIAASCLFAGTALGAYLELGPMVGHAGPKKVKIWAKASGPAQWSVRIGQQEDLADGRVVEGPELQASTENMGTVTIAGLEPDQRYYYVVRFDGEPAMTRPFPSFRTAPEPGTKNRLRFAFVSCLGHHGHLAAAAWGDMAARTR
jgi:alkaline phosphatase D